MTLPRIAVSALHLTVAIMIARRAPIRRLGSPRSVLEALPALVLAGFAFRLAAPLTEWSLPLQGVFLIGAGLAISTFLALGESFSVLPALRGIVCEGPYSVVRHPAYAGELLMLLACFLSNPTPVALGVTFAAAPFVVLRVRAEERLLRFTEAYRGYARRVRYRLVPGLW